MTGFQFIRVFAGCLVMMLGSSGFCSMTQVEYNTVLDSFERLYRPLLSHNKLDLKISRDWQNPALCAAGHTVGRTVTLLTCGGLPRDKAINVEKYRLILCHEFGHAVGGRPLMSPEPDSFASSGGQADYYATSVCMKLMLKNEDNERFIKSSSVEPIISSICTQSSRSQAAAFRCMRTLIAARGLGDYFAQFSGQAPVSFSTPDRTVTTVPDFDQHPNPQCRLDTFLSGALCAYEPTGFDVSDITRANAMCEKPRTMASRPLCWFQPK